MDSLAVAHLLGMPVEDLCTMLISTTNIMRGEVLRKNFNVEKAEDNRDALAKVDRCIFSSFMLYIIAMML